MMQLEEKAVASIELVQAFLDCQGELLHDRCGLTTSIVRASFASAAVKLRMRSMGFSMSQARANASFSVSVADVGFSMVMVASAVSKCGALRGAA
jgi:hypothetical protein